LTNTPALSFSLPHCLLTNITLLHHRLEINPSTQYYPYVNNDTIDARGLLEQNLQDFGLSKFNWLNGVAKAVKLPMRISETNSL